MDVRLDEYKKKISFRLEQLISETEYKKRKYEEGESEYEKLEAYEDGVTAAYIIVKKILEGNYE